VETKRADSHALLERLRGRRVYPSAATNGALTAAGVAPLSDELSAAQLLARPTVRYAQLQHALGLPDARPDVIEQVEVEAKYGGYIERQGREVERLRRTESRRLPEDLDYAAIGGLRNEARQVLQRFRPATLGQAARLAGINPADVAVLLVALERAKGKGERRKEPA
jgi:tRNA uridine 5-carboxymethylaminomethyl modification enzyme